MVIGCAVWLAYIIMTLVIRFKNKAVRQFMAYIDWINTAFHLAMNIWANIIYWGKKDEVLCASRWNFFL